MAKQPVASDDPTLFRSPPDESKGLSEESRGTLRKLRRARKRSGALSPLPYNLTISHKHSFVWFRNAKVATRTITGYLEMHSVDPERIVLSRTPYPTQAFASYFKFGFVRHPLDRFVSAWQDKVMDQNHFDFEPAEWERMKDIEAFAEWVGGQDLMDLGTTDRHIAYQSRLIDLTQVDYLGRLENFAQDFANVCQLIGLPPAEPETRNQTGAGDSVRDELSERVRSLVEEMYRRDYQVLGY